MPYERPPNPRPIYDGPVYSKGSMIADKLGSMTRALLMLDEKYNRLVIAGSGWFLGDSITTAKQVSYNAIQTLKGNHVKPGDINPYQRAIDDDEYLVNAWIPLAQQTQDNMEMALGYSEDYSLSTLFVNTATGAAAVIADSVPSANQATASLGFIAVAAVAVAIIVIMK